MNRRAQMQLIEAPFHKIEIAHTVPAAGITGAGAGTENSSNCTCNKSSATANPHLATQFTYNTSHGGNED